jgi:hypothetical protein
MSKFDDVLYQILQLMYLVLVTSVTITSIVFLYLLIIGRVV